MSVVSRKKKIGITIAVALVILIALTFAFSISTVESVSAAPMYDINVMSFPVSAGEATFTIGRNTTDTELTIKYRTVSGTAIAGIHFTYNEGSLTFAIGESSKDVIVTVADANAQYTTYETSQYTNIDRNFFLEIYNVPSELTYQKFSQATLTKDSLYEIDSNYFSQKSFYDNNSIAGVDVATPYYQKIDARGGYYDLVSNKYAVRIATTLSSTTAYQTFGLSSGEGLYPSYSDAFLTGIGDVYYAVQIEDNNGEAQDMPYVSGGNLRSIENISASTYLLNQFKSVSVSIDADDMLVIDSGDFYLFAQAKGTDAVFIMLNQNVYGKVIESAAPALVGTSAFESTYRTNDSLRISLIFDKIVDVTNSDLATSYLTTNSGNFNYVSGAGSNVLVFEGQLSASVVDEITVSGFNGSVQDFTGNETASLSVTPLSINIEKADYTVEHYKISPTGFVLSDTENLQGDIDATVNAVPKAYTGFTTFDTVDTVESGTATEDGLLVLKLYYKMTNVYLSSDGSDTHDGLYSYSAVKTFAKAKELLAIDGTILLRTLTISTNEEWSLAGYGSAKVMRSHNNSTMIIINSTGQLTLSNIVIDGNKGAFSGMTMISVAVTGKLITYDNTILQNNNASAFSIETVIRSAGTTTLNNTTIKDSLAQNGGAISNLGTLTINGGILSGNTATSDGGAIYNQGIITINDSLINNNQASNGGGIFNLATITLNNSTIENNDATNGGGIHNQSILNINSGIIQLNDASSEEGGGGGVFNSSGTVTINDNAIILNNEATGSVGRGGGVHSTGSASIKGKLIINSGTVEANSAKEGGGIYVTANSYITLVSINAKIKNNTASAFGGGIASASSPELLNSLSVDGALIEGNTSNLGGGIYVFGGNFVIGGTTKIQEANSASSNGGGVYIAATGTFTMKGGSILNNRVSGTNALGGAIYCLGTLIIEAGQTSGNLAHIANAKGNGVVFVGASFKLATATSNINEMIYLSSGNRIYVTSIPTDARMFYFHLHNWTVNTEVISGDPLSLNVGNKYENFALTFPDGYALRYSEDYEHIVLREAVTVSFNKNDVEASGTMNHINVIAGDTFTLPLNNFIKDKYVFIGWAENPEDTEVAYENGAIYTIGLGSVTLYAIWEKEPPTWQDAQFEISSFAGGNGTKENPYLISDGKQLAYLARLVNMGNSSFNNKQYKLTNNIDLGDTFELGVENIIWVGIGNITDSFMGTFDGNGYEVFNLYFNFNVVVQLHYGLFGRVSNGAVIKNLGIRDISYVGSSNSSYVGGLVAQAQNSSFVNVYAKNISMDIEVTSGNVGGLIGRSTDITIENFFIDTSAPITLLGEATLGSIVGHADSYIKTVFGYVIFYGESDIYLENTVEIITTTDAYEMLYDASVAYNAAELKSGRDIRFYRWTENIGTYPTLTKYTLRTLVYLDETATPRNLGQNNMVTFDEVICTLMINGSIYLASHVTISGEELWTLPESVFGTASIIKDREAEQKVIVQGTITLKNITINNSVEEEYFFYVDGGTLNVEEGTSFSGPAIENDGDLIIKDSETNGITFSEIKLKGALTLSNPLYNNITLSMDSAMVGDIAVQPDNVTITDVTIYKSLFTLIGPYILIEEGDYLRVYEQYEDIYLDLANLNPGIGTELSPFNTFKLSKSVVPNNGTIHIIGTITIAESTSWNLTGQNVTITRTSSSVAFVVTNSSIFTLTDVLIDISGYSSHMFSIENSSTLKLVETDITAPVGTEVMDVLINSSLEMDGLSSIDGNIKLHADSSNEAKIILNGDIATENFYNISLSPNNWGDGKIFVQADLSVNITAFISKFNLISYRSSYEIIVDETENALRAGIIKFTANFIDKLGGDSFAEGFEDQTINIYNSVSEPVVPFRLGYQFMEWKNAADNTAYDFMSEVTEDITLYADWQNYFNTEDTEGTELSPFVISNYSQLQNMSYLFSDESGYYNVYKDKYYILSNDIIIDELADSFVPIGNITNHFLGTLDGDGFAIKNIKIYEDFSALVLINAGTITSLGLYGEIVAEEFAAGFAIVNTGTISQCYNAATITSTGLESMAAGIVAIGYDVYNHDDLEEGEELDPLSVYNGTVEYCYNIGTIISIGIDGMAVGISGMLGIIDSCYNAGIVNGMPITLGSVHISNCFYNEDLYDTDNSTPLITVEMVGQNTATHTNVLYSTLISGGNESIWMQASNDGKKWYYPQLAVFAARGVSATFENVHTVTYEFDNGDSDVWFYHAEGVLIEEPADPEKALKLFDGWYILEGIELTELYDFETMTINADLTLRATWVTYRYVVFDDEIVDIEIGDGVTDLEIIIPNTIVYIASYALAYENIMSVLFEADSSLETINEEAFKDTKITTITVPKSVQNLYSLSFLNALLLETILVEEGSPYFKSIDGILYNADETNLIAYPYDRRDDVYEMPATVTSINEFAFIGYFDYFENFVLGNPYLTTLILSDALAYVGDMGLYSLPSLERVIIRNSYPLFEAANDTFKYETSNENFIINPNLVIELPSFTAFENYMASTRGWDAFEAYYSYPLIVTFEYEGATGGNDETTRTKVGGAEEGEIILNGMAMGTMPVPKKFGFDFVKWNIQSNGSGDDITSSTLLFTDITVYAIWTAWQSITIENGLSSSFTVVNGVYYEKTATEVLAVNTVVTANFIEYTSSEQIILSDKTIQIMGLLETDFEGVAFSISGSSFVEISMSIMALDGWFVIPQGSDGTWVDVINDDTIIYRFNQSETSDMTYFEDRVTASLPDAESNILTWNSAGNVGRNMSEIDLIDLPTDLAFQPYSPMAKQTIAITDTTANKIYNAFSQAASYTTNRDEFENPVICDITYYDNEEDMLNREFGSLSIPTIVGTYYYVISRSGYLDYCDADDVTGNYSIQRKLVEVVAIEEVSINKTFNGSAIYDTSITVGVHYSIVGIVDDATISIGSIILNSSQVASASYATVAISISDTHNYMMAESFDIDASISPLSVEVDWTSLASYTYNAENRSNTVSAEYIDINEVAVILSVTYSGTSTIFKNAGDYTATATNSDTNYTITNFTLELAIAKAEVTVQSTGVHLSRVFNDTYAYTGALVLDTDYTVTGIVDEAFVTINQKLFNSNNVTEANIVRAYITISDTDNYAIADYFVFDASISPFEISVTWTADDTYVYTAEDQGATVVARYMNVYDSYVPIDVVFSLTSAEFLVAGEYVATAVPDDTNYLLSNTTRNLTIQKAVITVEQVIGVIIAKTFDGNPNYPFSLTKDTHYIVDGIVDGVVVIIGSITFDSSQVVAATQATAAISLSDYSNYTMAGSFTIDAEINPLEVNVEWFSSQQYIYNSQDQGGTVTAKFVNIDSMDVPLAIEFSGKSEIFRQAGSYLATSSTDDTNYKLLGFTLNLEIGKAVVTVSPLALVSLNKVFDNTDIYYEELVKNEHYVVQGITDGAIVTIGAKIYNSSFVTVANMVTVNITISDTDNYAMAESFVFDASISPFEVAVNWTAAESYIYTSENQKDTVVARYMNVYDSYVTIDVVFSGTSAQFVVAGGYVATAIANDTNYLLSNTTKNLTIQKATVTVGQVIGIVIAKTFDGNSNYPFNIVKDTHYTVEGIVDGVVVIIGSITLDSKEVSVATQATVAITLSDYSNYIMAESFIIEAEINPLEVNVEWFSSLSYVYNGLEQSDTISARFVDVADAFVALTIMFSGHNTVFETAGSYQAKASTLDTNYTLIGNTLDFVINKAQAVITAESIQIHTYDGNIKNVVATLDHSETTLEQQGYTAANESGYTIIVSAEETANYLQDSKTITLIINKATIDMSGVSFNGNSFIYNGTNHSIYINDVLPTEIVSVTYYSNSLKNVGSVIVTAEFSYDEDNYNVVNDMTAIIKVTPLDVSVEWFSSESYVYNGSEQSDTISARFFDVEDAFIALTVIFSGQNEVFETAGSYLATAITEDTNYTLIGYTLELVMDKAQAVITADSIQTHTYDGSVKDVEASLDHSETNLVYDEQQGYTTANEGGYAIIVSAEETANYLAATKTVTLIINKATIDMSAVSFNNNTFIYNGTNHSIYITDTLPVEIQSTTYISNSRRNVGSTLVTAEFTYDTTNYNVVEDMTATITVDPRTVYITIHDKQSVYGEPIVTLTCTVTNQITGDELSLSLTKQGTMNAGDYEITGEINNNNYVAEITNGTYIVQKAIHNMNGISFLNRSLEYNAQPQSVIITGTLPQGVQQVYTGNTAINVGSYNAKVSFVYDEANYEVIADITATLTIFPRKITVAFSGFNGLYTDGTVKTISASLINVPSQETGAIVPIISYDKQVIAADYYTATVTINNDNYELIGTVTKDFIVYKRELGYIPNETIEVMAIYGLGFLPETTISVTNVSKRTEIASGLFAGKESKQTFDIIISGTLEPGQKVKMMLLINDEYRYLENLRIAMLDQNGNMQEIESVREGDYLIFDVSDTEGTYVIIGDGKGVTEWAIPAVAGSIVVIGFGVSSVSIRARKRKKLRQQVIGK